MKKADSGGSGRNSMSDKAKAGKSSQESLSMLKEPLAILEDEIQKYQMALDSQQPSDGNNDKYKVYFIRI